jgi:hypothetical protein
MLGFLVRISATSAKSAFFCSRAAGVVDGLAEDTGDRATRRADKLRARLGWEPGILNDEGGKPKWMRWRTFERMAAKHNQLVARSLQAAASKFGLLVGDFLD